MSEALLPGTDAIMRGTIEETKYRGRYLVRWKDRKGNPWRRMFDTVEESHEFFLRVVNAARERCRREVDKVKGKAEGTYILDYPKARKRR